jgi:hypothetical protein
MTVEEIKPVLAAVLSAKGKQTDHLTSLSHVSLYFLVILTALTTHLRIHTPSCTLRSSITDPNRPLLEGDITSPDINSMIQHINLRLTPLDYQIRSARDQRTKTLTYALVNTTSDPLTQLATTFSADEIAFLRRVLDAMFEVNSTGKKEVMAITVMQVNQLAKAPRRDGTSQINGEEEGTQAETNAISISMSDAETVLDRLVSQQFFQKSRANYYSLAPRGLMELRSFLKETYNTENEDGEMVVRVRDCEGCREIVTVGLRCRNRQCSARWHDMCAQAYFNAQRGEKRCSKCRTEWTGDRYVGERAAQVPQRAGGSSMAARSSGAGARSQVQEDDEDDEDE